MGRSGWRTAILKLSVVAASLLFTLLALEVSIRIWDWYSSRQARAALAPPLETAPEAPAEPAAEPPVPPEAAPPESSAPPQASPPAPAPEANAPKEEPGKQAAGNWIVPDDDLIYRLPPDHPGFSRRGSQRSLAGQPPAGFRVLILGDSVAYYGRDFADTLPGMIEGNLSRDAALQPAEFLNPSIVGYTNYQELLWLKKYGLAFEPKLVGVVFVLNDVHKFLHSVDMPGGAFPSPDTPPPSARRRPAISPFAAMAAEPEPPAADPSPAPQLSFNSQVSSGLPDIVLWAGRHSRLLQVLNRNLDIVKRTVQWYESRGYTFEYRADFYTAWQDEPWRMIDDQSAELAELGAKHGFQVFLVAVPFGDQYREDYLERDRDYVLKPQRKLAEICAAHGIAYLDLYSQLTLDDFVDDRIHFDGPGRHRAAARITEFLTREELIPPRP